MRDDNDLTASLRLQSTAALLAILRENDTNEWRPEVFEVARALLRERAVDVDRALASPRPASHGDESPGPPSIDALADAPALPDTLSEETPSSKREVIATFATLVEAEPCRSALASAGFDVSVVDENMIAVDPILWRMLGGLKLAVPLDQADDARAFVDAVERGDFASSPEVAIQCSACGSLRVRYTPGSDRSDSHSPAFPPGGALSRGEAGYVCPDCGAAES
jgi:hypothetical protein